MQSYLDVSMMVVIGAVVVLLIFILISFIISSHRSSVLEKENSALRKSLDQALKALNEQVTKQEEQVLALDRKSKSYDKQLNYVTQTLEDLIDKQRSIDTSFDNLQVKVEQTKKEFENNSVENQPIILAKRLLSEGMSIDEVIAKTNLPSYEVSMLAKVHNLQARPKTIEEQAHQMTEQYQSAQVNTNSEVQDPLAQGVEENEETQAFARKMQPTHHVANLKARDAYGIGSKSILRRPR